MPLIVFAVTCLVSFLSVCGQPLRSISKVDEDQQMISEVADYVQGASDPRRTLALLFLALKAEGALRLPSRPAALVTRHAHAGLASQRSPPSVAQATGMLQAAQALRESDSDSYAASPGQAEKQHFQCDPSVALWEDIKWDGSGLVNLQRAAAIVAKYMPRPFERTDGQALEFWGKHAARLGYFLTNAAAGLAAFGLFGKNRGAVLDEAGGFGDQMVGAASGLILEAIMTYEQDWKNIADGKYAMPWDMAAGHRQTTLPYALRQSARFVEEAVGTLERRSRGTPEDRKIWLGSGDIYPEYYKTNFHYQGDGWMSTKSAAVYETATETLFLGKQDAMQRTALLPLQGLKGKNGRPAKILEVACGTGRFATFLRDNHPTADLTCVDLSPFYLEAARENDQYWRNFRSQESSGEQYAPATFVQAAAEALPFEDESYDAVVCVYLFHEMPEDARAAAAAEMARVLKPGGVLVLTDSFQSGDRPVPDNALDSFEKLNEPHVSNYFHTHLASLFVPHGLECGHKYTTSVSKTLSFTKPVDTAKPSGSGEDDADALMRKKAEKLLSNEGMKVVSEKKQAAAAQSVD